jgi:hypothetical protein
MCAPGRKSCAASCTAARFDRPRTEPLGEGARGVPEDSIGEPGSVQHVVLMRGYSFIGSSSDRAVPPIKTPM